MSDIDHTKVLQLRDAPIEQAVVYSSGSAQIKRTFQLSLGKGYNEIRIQNLPSNILTDSIRVSGKGAAIIHDVSVKNQHGADMVIPERVQALKQDMENKEELKNKVDDKRISVNKRISALDSLINAENVQPRTESSFVFNRGTIENLANLYQYYQKESQNLRHEIRKLDVDFAKADEAYQHAQNAYDQTGYRYKNFSQYASIVIEANSDNENVELELLYLVGGVSWSAFYDIRVSTGDKPELIIKYYGKISQNGGEDWNSVPLILSTAQPSSGGKQLPKLGTLDVSIAPPEPAYAPVAPQAFGSRMMMKSARMDAAPVALFGAATAEVRKSAISTEFVIERPATIEDGTNEYKVTIGVITLNPKLTYATVPSKDSSAFLIATVLNTSQYPIVAGEASIFLDGTFVNKIHIDDAVVNQKLVASLGVDPAIRIETKPVKSYQEQVGLVSKSNAQATEKTYVVSNHRDDSILLTIHEQIPRSTDSKIKVHLALPSAKHKETDEAPTVGAFLTKTNILDYTVKLGAGETNIFVIKYNIEHPTTEKIRFDEKF